MSPRGVLKGSAGTGLRALGIAWPHQAASMGLDHPLTGRTFDGGG